MDCDGLSLSAGLARSAIPANTSPWIIPNSGWESNSTKHCKPLGNCQIHVRNEKLQLLTKTFFGFSANFHANWMQLAHAHTCMPKFELLFCFAFSLKIYFHLSIYILLLPFFLCLSFLYAVMDLWIPFFFRKGEYFILNEQKVNSKLGSGFFLKMLGGFACNSGRIGQIWNDVPVQRAILAEFIVYQLKLLNWKLNRFRNEIHCMHCFTQNENSQNSPPRVKYFVFMNLTHLKAGAQKKIVWGPEKKIHVQKVSQLNCKTQSHIILFVPNQLTCMIINSSLLYSSLSLGLYSYLISLIW